MSARAPACFIFVCALAACTPAADDAPTSHPPWWQVTHEGRTSTLVGTMHHEVDADVLPDEVWDALAGARVVYTEADVREVTRDALVASVTLPDDARLRDTVSAQDWEAIRRAVAPLFEDPDDADTLQPWFLEGQAVGVRLPEVAQPMDATIVARADEAGVPLAFFETWQQQVALLNDLGVDDGLFVLLRSAYDLDAAVAAHGAWADAYVRADVDEMTALAFDAAEVQARPRYYEEIVGRHAGWLDVIEDEVRAGDAFFAAGFLHMLTDEGLPALLEARGYDVARVDP